ncbi:cache domain-containing protein [Vibrio sonorensis]|uniref:cache domain-containing protein n=1 Tax=Vibrio sonorensis TaxID=1004316 RepID=UPI0008DAE9C8|nr:cache domain-containing protein [Vibrio sonorensis]
MRFSLRVKSWVLFASIMPVLVALLVSAMSASKSVDQLNQERLIALRDVKQARVLELFERYKRNLKAVAFTAKAELYEYDSDRFHETMTVLNHELEFYDIFIVNPSGDIVYTVARESDYQTNLLNGPYAASGLGKLFASIKQGADFAAQDFTPYAPSNNEPAAFIGEPITVDGQTWMVATQMSIDGINSLMNLRSGMGETGETYLVGSDFRMRSDSYLDPEGHSIKASFAGTIEKNGVTSDAVKKALSGESGFEVVIDYNGNPVLSAYAPIEVYGFRWAVLAEIDEAEALIPVYQLLQLNGGVLIGALLAGLIAL